MSDFFPTPVPKTICWKSKNFRHKWTNDAYYRKHSKDNIIVTPATKPGQYAIPHLLWCIHCELEHQP